jgi:hypothetical protein
MQNYVLQEELPNQNKYSNFCIFTVVWSIINMLLGIAFYVSFNPLINTDMLVSNILFYILLVFSGISVISLCLLCNKKIRTTEADERCMGGYTGNVPSFVC